MALVVKNPPANAGDIKNVGLIPGSGRSPGEEHGNPLQYSCLENPMDRGAWWLQSVESQSRTWPKLFSTHAHIHTSTFLYAFLVAANSPASVAPATARVYPK